MAPDTMADPAGHDKRGGSGMRRAWPLAAGLLLTGCASTSQAAGAATPPRVAASTTAASPTPGPTTPTAGATTATPTARVTTAAPARQLITVTAASWTATEATLTGYDGQKRVLGPWTVHLGRAGLARPGA